MLPLLSPKLITIPGGSMARSARGNLQVTAAVKAKSARHICCSKTLIAKPEHKEAVKQLCEEVMQFTKQQMAQKSNGIHEFQCLVDGWDDNVFHFWERYESNVTLGRHNTRPEVEAFMNKVVPLLEKPVGMALYEYRDGQIGAVSTQAGPKGEGGLDDATGASGAAGGASYKQTSKAAQLTYVVDDEDEGTASSIQGASAPESGDKVQDVAADSAAAWASPAALAVTVGILVALAYAALQIAGH